MASHVGEADADGEAAAALCLMATLVEQEQIVPSMPRRGNGSSSLGSSISTSASSSSSSSIVSTGSATSPVYANTPQLPLHVLQQQQQQQTALGFVKGIPVVSSAVSKLSNAYEASKASSVLIKFGAETVESSVRKIYGPISTIVEPHVGNINEFGLKHLEKLTEQFPIVMDQPETIYEKSAQYISSFLTSSPDGSAANGSGAHNHQNGYDQHDDDDMDTHDPTSKRSSSGLRRRVMNHGNGNGHGHGNGHGNGNGNGNGHNAGGDESDSDGELMEEDRHQRKRRVSLSAAAAAANSRQRSGNTMLVENTWSAQLRGMYAYGKSNESLQLVRQTVDLMQAVEQHIERNVTYMTGVLQQLQEYISQQTAILSGELAVQRDRWLHELSATYNNIRKDIANAIRQVVDILSRSATVLPAFAQQRVKDFVLSLPQRWAAGANALIQPPVGAEAEVRFLQDGHQMIALSNETRNMLRSLIFIFAQYFEKANAFLNNLTGNEGLNNPTSPSPASIAALLNYDTNGHIQHAPIGTSPAFSAQAAVVAHVQANSVPDMEQRLFSSPPHSMGHSHSKAGGRVVLDTSLGGSSGASSIFYNGDGGGSGGAGGGGEPGGDNEVSSQPTPTMMRHPSISGGRYAQAQPARKITAETLAASKVSGRLYLNNMNLREFPLNQLLEAEAQLAANAKDTSKGSAPLPPKTLQIMDVSFNQLERFPRQPLPFPTVEALDLSGNQLGRKVPQNFLQLQTAASMDSISSGGGATNSPPATISSKKGTRRSNKSDTIKSQEGANSNGGSTASRRASSSFDLKRNSLIGSSRLSLQGELVQPMGELVQVAEGSGLVEALQGMDQLKIITLSFNMLTKGFALNNAVKNLLELRLNCNALTNLDDFDLAQMPKLQTLLVKGNKLQQICTRALSDLLPDLRKLDLTVNDLDGFAFEASLPASLTHLELGDNHIRSLPASFLLNLPNLVSLNLEANSLKALPPFSAEHKALETLYLSNNRLTELPPSIGFLVGLQKLEVNKNQLTDLPAEIGSLKELDHLDVSQNALKALPETIGDLANLRILLAGGNMIKALPATISKLNEKFICVILRRNPLGTNLETLAPLWGCASLVELDLCATNLRQLPEDINKLTALTILRLAGNHLTELGRLDGISNFVNTDSGQMVHPALFLNDNRFQEFPKSLLPLKALQTLILDSNPIDSVPAEITTMTKLTTLSISLKVQSGKGSSAPLPNLSTGNIKRLYLGGTLPTGPGMPVPPLPLSLADTDIPQSDRLPTATKAANLIKNRSPTSRAVAFSQMLGSAPHSLEDTVATTSVPWRNNERLDFVAIFDGHGGATVSLYCQSHFYEEFENQLKEVAQIEDEEAAITAALKATFLEVNFKLRQHLDNSKRPDAVVGCTGVVVVVSNTHIYCGNAGDSRAVLARRAKLDEQQADDDGNPLAKHAKQIEAVRLSVDHKPSLRDEIDRIVKVGGFITQEAVRGAAVRLHSPNVSNGLAVSRAFGDFPLAPPVTVEPFISSRRLDADDLFVVVGCDGVWDVLTDHEAAIVAVGSVHDVTKNKSEGVSSVAKGFSLSEAAHRLRGWSYTLDSFDDISTIILDVGRFYTLR